MGQARTLTRFCCDYDICFACNGGCPKDRLRSNRVPAELMRVGACQARDAALVVHDPCACGSGCGWKHHQGASSCSLA